MKKIALTCISLSLAACGGETYFNEPAADVSACVVGTWEPAGDVADYIYSSTSTYYSDGTYRQETIIETSTSESWWTGIATWLFFDGELQDDTFDRFEAVRTTGGWEYRDGLFFSISTDTERVKGESPADALANVPWESLVSGVPISETASSSAVITGSTVHCDEQFMDTKVLHTVSESPLIYRSESKRAYPDYTYLTGQSEEFILFDNGSGSYSTIDVNYISGNIEEKVRELEYIYNGNMIDIRYSLCETCQKDQTRELYDRGSTVTYGNRYVQRVQ